MLVTGATGRVGRAVVDLLTDAGVPVRALVHRSESAATLPANVEIANGDLTVPESLDAVLQGISTVLLVWTAPPETAAAVVDRLAAHVQRVVFLSAPHRTPHPFFQQPNPMAALFAEIERLITAAGLDSTIIRPGMFASNALFWWAAAIRGDGVVRWPYGAAEDVGPLNRSDVGAACSEVGDLGQIRHPVDHDVGVTSEDEEAFLSVRQVELYGRFGAAPSGEELERFFFLDDQALDTGRDR